MNQVSRAYNEQVIKECMSLMDFDYVLKIPLPMPNMEDFWASNMESSGVFSVRSAYRMLIHMKKRGEAWLDGQSGNIGPNIKEKAWTKMWCHKIPSKVKIFA